MRGIERTGQFKRDYKREVKSPHRATLEQDFIAILDALLHDQPLAERYHDHALAGDWKDHRDGHIKPDLVLIYRKPDNAVLQLVRLGSPTDAPRRSSLVESIRARIEPLGGINLELPPRDSVRTPPEISTRDRTGHQRAAEALRPRPRCRVMAWMMAQPATAAVTRSRGAALATRNTRDFVDCGIDLIDPWAAAVA